MNMHVVEPTAPPPAPAEKKTRLITLTNRAPVKITEDKWPVIAQGSCGETDDTGLCSWSIDVRVRENPYGICIVHAKYAYYNEIDEASITCRVGHLLHGIPSVTELWQHINEVGDELRARIPGEGHRKYVTTALDDCFAALPAQVLM